MGQKQVLIVDGDLQLSLDLQHHLQKQGYGVTLAENGKDGLSRFRTMPCCHLVLLDVVLSKLDGWELCREIRSISQTPIIIITKNAQTFHKVLGLDLGADDYLVKPFDETELLARINAVLRRYHQNSEDILEKREISLDHLNINLSTGELHVSDTLVPMPPKEIALLFYLASHPNRVFTRTHLLDQIWGFEYYGDSRTVDVHIKRIREKIKHASFHWSLNTVWGVGYKFEVKHP